MKAWMLEVAHGKDFFWTEPVDDVDAAILQTALSAQGMHPTQHFAARSLQDRIAGELESGSLKAGQVNLRIGGCACGKCNDKGRRLCVAIAGSGVKPQAIKAVAINPIEAALDHIKSVHKSALEHIVAGAKAAQAPASEFAPVVGGFPLLDAEPPAGGWKKPPAATPVQPIVRPADGGRRGPAIVRPRSLFSRLLAGLAWFFGEAEAR